MKEKWKKSKLRDICEYITSGGTPKSDRRDYYNPPIIPWLTSKEVNFNRVWFTNEKISQQGLEKSSAKLIPANSIIIAMYGNSAGRVAIAKISLCTNQACCNLIINKKKANYNFIYYLLSINCKKLLLLKAGAAQQNLSLNKISNLELPIPPLEIQQKIAQILSHYDDLIEVNKHRIALLEESARELYNEWFVRMRFPGCGGTKFVDGIPEGWKIKQLNDLCYISAGKDKPTDVSQKKDLAHAFPIFSNGIEDDGLFGYTTSPRIINKSFTISARGTIGFVALHLLPFVPIVRLLVLIPKQIILLNYLYLWAKYNTIKGNGTSQQQLTVPMISKVKVIIPTTDLLAKFSEYISKFVMLKENTKQENYILAHQRDRLLSRLMSGRLEV